VVRYVTACEKAGIPSVALGFADQVNFAHSIGLVRGVPNLRWVDTARTGTGPERAQACIENVIKALTTPLTAKEKESGLYTPPPPPRIIFEGTLDDAQVYFQQTTPIANCRNCPIAKYTDGAPIIVPTEEKVREMLTGTSHKPDENVFSYSMNTTTKQIQKATNPGLWGGGAYTTTVEKVAVVAVMAGCKPEYLPVALAIATHGGGTGSCPGTSGPSGFVYVVSGPIAKEIGMNSGQNALDVGTPSNVTLGRIGALMTINFGGCIAGVVRTDSGHGFSNKCIAEDEEGLPKGWETLREEDSYKKTETSIAKITGAFFRVGTGQYAPSSFRSLVSTGSGGMARRMGVEGKPGPKNFLEYVMPLLIPTAIGGRTLLMAPNMAISLYEYGFKTKAAVSQWMVDTYFITQGEYEQYGWYDHGTQAGVAREPTSGKSYKDLPKDYKIHAFGTTAASNCIIVALGFADEICYDFPGRPSQRPIDVWK
jgi:hypothetical protein